MIETERLVLRKWNIDDVDAMYLYAKDPSVGPMAGWKEHASKEVSKKIILGFIDHHPYCFAICLKDNINHAIGAIEIKTKTDMTDKSDEAEIGYWLGKPYWGCGYMPEALRAIVAFGFNELKLNAFWCGYYDGNIKSKRAQEKAGFIYHHTSYGLEVPQLNEVRTGHCTILTKEEWLKNK